MAKRCPLFFSLILTLLVLAFSILSLSFPWYIVGRSRLSNEDDIVSTVYYWDGYKIKDGTINGSDIIYSEGKKSELFKYKDLEWDNIQKVIAITLGFVVVGTLMCVISTITIFIVLFTKKRGGAIAGGIFQLITFALLLAGFFQFFRIQEQGFQKDDPFCMDGGDFDTFKDKTYCNKFLGTTKTDTIEMKFVGNLGWIFCIIASFFSLFSFIPSFVAAKKGGKSKYSSEKPVKFDKV